jgi:hypothetical protein
MYSALKDLTIPALKSLASDLRAQVDIGLLSRKDAHDRINVIAAVIMKKEMERIDDDIAEMTNEEYDEYLFDEKDGVSEGDELMTNGWAE